MKKLKLFEKVKKYKDPIMMIASTVLEVGAVIWAFRAGAKAKEALEELPEDATAKDRVCAAGPHMVGPIVAVGAGEALKYMVNKNNLDKIAELGVLAVAANKRADIQDEAVKEVVDEKTYEAIEEKVAQKSVSLPVNDIVDTGSGEDIFVFAKNNQALKGSKNWLEKQLLQAVTDARPSKDYEYSITLNQLAGYFKLPGDVAGHDAIGYSAGKLPSYLKFYNPLGDPTTDNRFGGKRYIIFDCDIQPHMLSSNELDETLY